MQKQVSKQVSKDCKRFRDCVSGKQRVVAVYLLPERISTGVLTVEGIHAIPLKKE